jgi:acyl-coenzyme A synthetase/AMP-(fatty) acid ligase
MPYLRWLETARRFANEVAVHDGDSALTFGELAAAAEAAPTTCGPVVARTGSAGFLIDLLRAWRDGQAAIPVEKDAPEPILKRQPPPDIRLVKHTPGASGVPRGIFLTGDQLAADAARLVGAMEMKPGEPNLGVISLAHSYGFSSVVLPMLFHGVPIRMVSVPFPRVLEDAMRRQESVVLPAVPSMWRAWQRSGVLRGAPVRLAVSAGAPLSLALEREVFDACGLKIHNFYGASECGGIAYDRSDTPRPDETLLGTALPGVTLSTRDGRLLVSSDAVASGYESPRADDWLENGCYLTRDIVRIDEFGNLFLTATTGGAINVAGRKVSPAKVEAAILRTGLAVSVAIKAVPSPDPERHEEIEATIEPADGANVDQIRAVVSSLLPSWEIPRHWRVR